MISEAFAITKDREWLESHAQALSQTLAFYDLYSDAAGLVHEQPFGNWEDSLLFSGARAFTNLLYLEAVRRAHDLFKELGSHSEEEHYDRLWQRIYEPTMQLIATQRDTETVALAALWLPNEKRIESWMREMLEVFPDTMPPNRWPIPPPSMCCMTLRIIGQTGYHRDYRWSNVGCLWAAALLQRGFEDAGIIVLNRFMKAMERFGTIHEVYNAADENPICNTLYRSETHFSMGIGPYLFAIHSKEELER